MTAGSSRVDGQPAAPAYRAFHLNDQGAIDEPAVILDAETDADAVREARRIFGSRPIEVWRGARRIADIEAPG